MMMHVYSDGSVKYVREKGTWAWEAYIAERPDRPNSTVLHLVAAGDGKEIRAPEATERVMRSGRAEPLALVAGLIALRAWRGPVAWYTDSQATTDTWNTIGYKSARKWASVDNKGGVWRALRRLKKKWEGRVNMIKVAAPGLEEARQLYDTARCEEQHRG
jgi:ribonuclease HI